MQLTGIVSDMKDSPFNTGSIFINPGVYANLVVAFIPCSFIIILYKRNNKYLSGYSAVIFILSVVILGFTVARTAWLAASIIILLMLDQKYMFHKKYVLLSARQKYITIFIFIASAIIVAYILYVLKSDSVHGRIFIWQNCLKLISEKPIFGYGYNMFYKEINDYQASYFMEHKNSVYSMLAGDVKFAFNDYLEMLINLGVTGLFFFIASVVSALFIKTPETTENRLLPLAAKFSVITILICSLFSYPVHTSLVFYLLFFNLAIISANSQNNIKTLTINKSLTRLTCTICILALIFFSKNHLTIIRSLKKWKTATEYAGNRSIDSAGKLYSEIFQSLKHNYYFLYNYGFWLNSTGKYNESINILEKATEKISNKDIYLIMGSCYQGLNELQKAETSYIKAGCFIPYLIVPKHDLFRLYRRTNNKPKALETAYEIKNQEIKIYSPYINDIKAEVTRYIESNEINNN